MTNKWEKEFDKICPAKCEVQIGEESIICDFSKYTPKLKRFISDLLEAQKKELLEKIEEYGCNEKNCQEGHYPISYNEENDETEWGGCPNCTSGGIRLEPYKTVDDIIRIIKEI